VTVVAEAPQSSVGHRASRRAVGSLVDQVLFSLGNFVVLFAALHLLDLNGFGQCSVAYAVDLVVAAAVRPMALEVLLVRFAVCDERERARAGRQSSGAALGIGLLAFGGIALTGVLLRDALTPALLVAGAALPAMLVQDAWRYQMFATGRQWAAAGNDAVCVLVTIGNILALDSIGVDTASGLLLAWGVGLVAGALLGSMQLRVVPDLRAAGVWLRDHRDYGVPLAAAALLGQVPARGGLMALEGMRGGAAAGQFAASMAVLLPMNTIAAAASSFIVPELARRRAALGPNHADRCAIGFGLGLGAVLGAGCAVVALLPARLGGLYAGRNWDASKTVLLPMAVSLVAMTICVGPRAALYLQGRMRVVMVNCLLQSVAQFGGLVVGAAVGGVRTAAWALAVGTIVGAIPWWRSCRMQVQPFGGVPGSGPDEPPIIDIAGALSGPGGRPALRRSAADEQGWGS
jgi:O-antigen/teichoic acid export membrane protein